MFHFTIRDALLVMVIIGLAVGWWIDHARLASRAERAAVLDAVVDSMGMSVTYQKQGGSVSQINFARKGRVNRVWPANL
jgi:hypothetical protein